MKIKHSIIAGLLMLGAPTLVCAADKGGVDIPMVKINPGSFSMGSNSGDSDERPVHQVRIGYAFELGKTEVTQGLWQAVMGENPSGFNKCGDDCPVENVSWDDIQRFLKRLNRKTGKEYRLPSEAEWEYACRAGGNDTYCGGNDLNKLGWYEGNSGKETSPVGSKQANAWGLYDMSGNVWEWVQDCKAGYDSTPTDGSAYEGGGCDRRMLRGGSCYFEPQSARAAYRNISDPANRNVNFGFRLARTLP